MVDMEKLKKQNQDFVFSENSFDFIRMIAAFIVVFSHSFRHFLVPKPLFLTFFTDGSIGVMIFFTISGFLNMASYERCCQNSKKGVFKYWFNRLIRVYPAILVLFVVNTIFDMSIGVYPTKTMAFLKHFIKDYVFFLGGGMKEHSISMGLFWTMRVELFFYILVPIIYYLGKKISLIGGICIILFFWMFNLFDDTLVNFISSENYFMNSIIRKIGSLFLGEAGILIFQYEFFIGSLFFLHKDKIFSVFMNKKFLLVYFVVWYIFYCIYNYSGVIKSFGVMHNCVLGLTTGPLVLGCSYAFGKFKMIDISYGIYIYHWPLIQIFLYHDLKSSWYMPLVWILIIIFALMSFYCVERPLMKLKKKVGNA